MDSSSNDTSLAGLHRNMIRTYLESRDLRFFTDQEGDFFLIYDCAEKVLHIRIGLDDDGQVMWFECTDTVSYKVDEVAILHLTLNTWMSERRWPRLSLRVRKGSGVSVVADNHLALGSSLEDGEIVRFLDTTIGATLAFWEEFSIPNMAAFEDEIERFLDGGMSCDDERGHDAGAA